MYYYEEFVISSENEDWASAIIQNPNFTLANGGICNLTVRFSWSTQNLNRLVPWKMPGVGVHVLGIEPANYYVKGRAKQRERETLVVLEAGQLLSYELKLEISVK